MASLGFAAMVVSLSTKQSAIKEAISLGYVNFEPNLIGEKWIDTVEIRGRDRETQREWGKNWLQDTAGRNVEFCGSRALPVSSKANSLSNIL